VTSCNRGLPQQLFGNCWDFFLRSCSRRRSSTRPSTGSCEPALPVSSTLAFNWRDITSPSLRIKNHWPAPCPGLLYPGRLGSSPNCLIWRNLLSRSSTLPVQTLWWQILCHVLHHPALVWQPSG
jgi:hypothetical protein